MVGDEEHVRTGKRGNVARPLPWNMTQALAVAGKVSGKKSSKSEFVAERSFKTCQEEGE